MWKAQKCQHTLLPWLDESQIPIMICEWYLFHLDSWVVGKSERAFLWHLRGEAWFKFSSRGDCGHAHGAPHHIPFACLISGTWGTAPCTPGSHGELAQAVSKCGWTKDTVATSANERWIPQPPVEKSEAFCSFPQSPQGCLQWDPGEAFTGFPPFLAHCPHHLTSASWDHLPNKLCEPSSPSQALLSEGATN